MQFTYLPEIRQLFKAITSSSCNCVTDFLQIRRIEISKISIFFEILRIFIDTRVEILMDRLYDPNKVVPVSNSPAHLYLDTRTNHFDFSHSTKSIKSAINK